MGYLLKLGMVIVLWAAATVSSAKAIVDPAITEQEYLHVTETLQKFSTKAGADFLEATFIKPSLFNDFLEVTAGNFVVYISKKEPYLLIGNAFDVDKNADQWNVTQNARRQGTLHALARIPREDLVIYPATVGAQYLGYVTVFTDVECGYCRKFHEQIKQINDYGIEVRYVAFPRMGLQSDSYHKSVAIWCAKDRLEAMTHVKNGEYLTIRQCQNPVAEHYAMGQKLLLGGTPTIFFENGEIQPGYMTAKALAEKIAQLHK